jgi:uncharacterized protein YjbI with pentapeptide repeats
MSFDETVAAIITHQNWLDAGGWQSGSRPEVFQEVDLSGVDLMQAVYKAEQKLRKGVSLRQSSFYKADLTGVQFWPWGNVVTLQGASFESANLTDTSFAAANFQDAKFNGSILLRADFLSCNLIGASFLNTDLTEAVFASCAMRDILYEPKAGTIPNLYALRVSDLEGFRYAGSALGLVQLRNAFKQNGLRDEERVLTYIIEHARIREAWQQKRRIEASFRYLLFELPSAWGLHPERCLQVLGVGVFIFTVPYFLAICCRTRMKRAGIWAVRLKDPVQRADRGTRAVPVRLRLGPTNKKSAVGVAFLRTLGTAFYFSLLSAFHIGFREINVGSWISRMQPREYTLRATGWVRMVAGLQSLLSVYFVALWLLTYFGRPFE